MANEAVLPEVEAALVAHFGHRPQRASVSFVGVDPIEVLRFEPEPDERWLVTLGMSRYPMTGAEELMLAADGPRAELCLRVRDPTDTFPDLWRSLAVLAAAPAVEGVVYVPGASSDLGQPLATGSGCSGVLVTEPLLAPVETGGGAVDVLTVLPATRAELAWCRARGSAALRARWEQEGTELDDLARPGVRLDPA